MVIIGIKREENKEKLLRGKCPKCRHIIKRVEEIYKPFVIIRTFECSSCGTKFRFEEKRTAKTA